MKNHLNQLAVNSNRKTLVSLPHRDSLNVALLIMGLVAYSLHAAPAWGFQDGENQKEARPPNACRSVHLWWQHPELKAPESTAFYNELTIEKSTPGSYFMACGFSKGYFGIQELANGKKIALFSIWEPGKQNNPNTTPEERRVKPIAQGENVRVKRFGGEGTGGQSFYDYQWELGESVRFVVFAKPDGKDRTQYAGYIYIPNEHRWQHMATFSTLANGQLLRGYYSFVEDFLRNGKSATISRRTNCGNGWILPVSEQTEKSKWIPLTQARFTADRTPTDNIDSGIGTERFRDRIFMQTGGETKNENTKLRGTSKLRQLERKPPVDLPTPFVNSKLQRSQTVRLVSYNIKHGRGNDGKVDLDRIAGVIRRLNPDFVALQEIDNQAKRSGKIDQARFLARATGLKHSEFGSFFEFQGGDYGMAILSRFPLSKVNNLRLPNGTEPRTSLVAQVDHPLQSFNVANVHFYQTQDQRIAQAKTLLDELKPDTPTVVLGDFNSKPDGKVIQLFSKWTIPNKGKDHFTFSSDNPKSEIDFAMYRPNAGFELEAIDVIEEPLASDHRPVVIDLKLKRER